MRTYQQFADTANAIARASGPSVETMLQVYNLGEALKALQPGRIIGRGSFSSTATATAISAAPLDLSNYDFSQLRSTEEINTAPTSYQHNGPTWNGSTVTAPWSGTGSTADATVAGEYDGSNGDGVLQFRVDLAGTHGVDDLRIKIFTDDETEIGSIEIAKEDPQNSTYVLSNGFSITLGAGDLVADDYFEVDMSILSTSYTPSNPNWTVSTVNPTITGTYDASNGNGTLTFEALNGGIRGAANLNVRVYAPDGSMLEDIAIAQSDANDTAYSLSNGLSVTFSSGLLVQGDTFSIELETTTNFSTQPNSPQSTAAPALSGIYDGMLGTDVLEISVVDAGVHGTDDLSLEVRTSEGTLLETIFIAASDSIDQIYSLANGIDLKLSAGALEQYESFTLSINHLVPTSVNPSLSFDGVGANDANLEDPFTVTDGSFEINGNAITVFANDSIDSVLDRINNADIDVNAVFDELTETIMLQHEISGNREIAMSNDTSGFLAATKLLQATTTPGLGDATTTLSQLEIMAGVTSGSIYINGTSIAIDVDVDSLEDVISRIELVDGVEVDFDPDTGLVSIQSTNVDLSISSGGTSFFAAIGISDGLFETVTSQSGNSQEKGFSYHSRAETARNMKTFARHFNAIFEDKYGESADPYLARIRDQLSASVNGSIQQFDHEPVLGISFDFRSEKGPFDFSDAFQSQLSKSLKTTAGAKEFNAMFFDSEETDGVMDSLLNVVKSLARELRVESAMAGSFIDILV